MENESLFGIRKNVIKQNIGSHKSKRLGPLKASLDKKNIDKEMQEGFSFRIHSKNFFFKSRFYFLFLLDCVYSTKKKLGFKRNATEVE